MQKNGIPIECHFVITEDGYILRLYHLVQSSNTTNDQSPGMLRPILFMHGMISSSQDFVMYANTSAGNIAFN